LRIASIIFFVFLPISTELLIIPGVAGLVAIDLATLNNA